MPISIPSGDTATERDIATLEDHLGYRLSPQFRSFLQTHNGAKPESNIFDLGTNNSCGVTQFIPVTHIASEIALIGDLPRGAYPVAFADGGNWVVIDESQQGTVFFWDHETDGAQTRLAATFAEFLTLLRPFDPTTIELKPKQVKRVWIDPDFLNSLKERK